jgi:heptosyltransferase-1
VFTTPAIHALRLTFPGAHLAYVVEPACAPIVSRNPHLDDVIVAPRESGWRGFAADVSLGRRLRAERFDIAIDFHGGPRASLLTWLSGAPVRIGYEIAGRSWMYTRRVARPRALRPRHSVENQWDLLETLGIGAPDRVVDPVEMIVDPAAAAAVADRLARAGVQSTDRVIVIHVSAGNPFRRWPIDHFVDLAARLAAHDSRHRVVITSGPSESEAAARVIDGARAMLGTEGPGGDGGRRIVSCGEFSLAELRALLEHAVLFIGGDSGPLHVASTTRVPIVGLYGPTLPARSAPWRDAAFVTASVDVGALPCRPCDQRVCAPGDFRCLTRIDAGQVFAAAIKCLE